MKTATPQPLPKDQLAERDKQYRLVAIEDRCIVRPWPESKLRGLCTKLTILLPQGAQTQEGMIGDVIAVGPGAMQKSGIRRPFPAKVGDAVFYAKFGGIDIEWNGERLRAIQFDRVLARVVTEEKAEIEAAVSPEEREIRDRMEAAIADFRAFLEAKKGGA